MFSKTLYALVCVLIFTSNLHSATESFNISLRILKPSIVTQVKDFKKSSVFNLKGESNRMVTVSVVEEGRNFVVTGPKEFDEQGNAIGIKINPIAGAYAMNDSAVLRVIHQ